jgi:hypothetical protein
MLVRDLAYLESLDQSLSILGGRRWRSHRSVLIGDSKFHMKRHRQVVYNQVLPSLPEAIGVSLSLEDGPSVTVSQSSEARSDGGLRSAFASAGFGQDGSTFSYSSSAVSI